eukprot:m.168618 g.168618  ORF g.168618 m.168618 type:complete len:77 (-) comp16652_c0_seq9:3197-3427(-)
MSRRWFTRSSSQATTSESKQVRMSNCFRLNDLIASVVSSGSCTKVHNGYSSLRGSRTWSNAQRAAQDCFRFKVALH